MLRRLAHALGFRGYWVPRAEMRYRYRYRYFGPQYRYFPAWGYGGCQARGRCY